MRKNPAGYLGLLDRDSASMEALESRRMFSATPFAVSAADQPVRKPADYLSELLTVGDVEGILAAAASQARAGQVIVVTDREGVILGRFDVGGDGWRGGAESAC